MCPARRVLVLLSVLGFVVGIVNAYNFNKPTTDSKLELEDYINRMLIKWENKFLDKIITYIDSKTETVSNKIIQTLNLSKQNIEKKIDETIRANESNNKKYNMLEVKILETMNTLDNVKKELLEINRTLTNISCGKLPPLPHGSVELLNGTTNLGSVVQYSCASNYRLVGPARRTCAEDFQWSETAPTCEVLPCKVKTLTPGYTPWYSLDDVSLRHTHTLRRDSAGRREYLELRLAIQAGGDVGIILSDKDSGVHYKLWVGRDSNQRTRLWYNDARVQDISTPDILSGTEFRSFYIKVEDDILQFGKEGDAPLISYPADNLSSLNFYRLFSLKLAKLRFCPTVIEGS